MADSTGGGPWAVEMHGVHADHIKMDYQTVSDGVHQCKSILSEVEAGVDELRQALNLLHEVDRGRAATEFQGQSNQQVSAVENAQTELRGGVSYLDNKVGEFSEAEAQGVASFGGF